MASYIIAVCPQCQHHTVPLVLSLEADPPHCVKCARDGRSKNSLPGSLTAQELHKAPKMRIIETIPKEPVFKKKKHKAAA